MEGRQSKIQKAFMRGKCFSKMKCIEFVIPALEVPDFSLGALCLIMFAKLMLLRFSMCFREEDWQLGVG